MKRIPLTYRPGNDEWTDFETKLFNLITRHADQETGLFSSRLILTQVMLDAFDKEIECQHTMLQNASKASKAKVLTPVRPWRSSDSSDAP
jgi:hypothetical protein